MSENKSAKERYHNKTLKITFRLNLEETELAKRVLQKLDLKHNQLSKKLFLEYLNEYD